MPTGRGKTLLATEILGLIHRTILKERNGVGLVLWVVPSDQIYKDTLKALRDRRRFYRESLEFALSRRIEIWEKHEMFRVTPGQLHSNLNILLLKLASTNRETREQLKFFRDSGGNIVQHFPPEDEPEQHKALKAPMVTGGRTPDVLEAMKAKHPMGRIGRPEEVAWVACFLASDRASFLTGLAVPVAGGRHIR